MHNVFLFEDEELICERLYFDLLTIMQQLGIARNPSSISGRIEVLLMHPLTTLKAVLKAIIKF